MSSSAWPELAGALIALCASPLLLAHAWRRGDEGRVTRVGGWLALLVALVLFSAWAGLARGIALGLIALPVPALAMTWIRRNRHVFRQPQPQQRRTGDRARQGRTRAWRMLARVLIALPLSLLAAITCATQVSFLAGSLAGGVAVALGVVVALWALAAFWALADATLWRPAGGLALLALACGVPLWLP